MSTLHDDDNELVIEREEGLAVVRINRPAQMNSLSMALLARLGEAIPALIADSQVRAIMLTGTGSRAFCAGADVGMMGGPYDAERTLAGMRSWHHWMLALRLSEKIVISAVNGAAAGGGFGIALVADLVVASDAAFFKGAFSTLGVAADFGLGFTLPAAIGANRAAAIVYSDSRISAARALELGFVSELFPAETFAADARALAARIAAGPRGMQLTKRLLRLGEAEAFPRFLEAEAQTQTEAFATHDAGEGVRAFKERRAPRFAGR